MEVCSRRYLGIEQLSLKSAVGCEFNMKAREHAVSQQAASSPRRVICPEPRRAAWAPHIVDNLNRKCCTRKSYLPSNRGDPDLEILNIILSKDEHEDNSDCCNNPFGFFNGSPPSRTSNPLIHDVQFTQQTSICVSPSKDSLGGKATSERTDRVSSCGTSPFRGKPMVRIEGFACRGSKSNHIVPAFA